MHAEDLRVVDKEEVKGDDVPVLEERLPSGRTPRPPIKEDRAHELESRQEVPTSVLLGDACCVASTFSVLAGWFQELTICSFRFWVSIFRIRLIKEKYAYCAFTQVSSAFANEALQSPIRPLNKVRWRFSSQRWVVLCTDVFICAGKHQCSVCTVCILGFWSFTPSWCLRFTSRSLFTSCSSPCLSAGRVHVIWWPGVGTCCGGTQPG